MRIVTTLAWLVLLGPLTSTARADEAVEPAHEDAELDAPAEPGPLQTLLPWALPALGLLAIAALARVNHTPSKKDTP